MLYHFYILVIFFSFIVQSTYCITFFFFFESFVKGLVSVNEHPFLYVKLVPARTLNLCFSPDSALFVQTFLPDHLPFRHGINLGGMMEF